MMTPSWRKPAGILAILAIIMVWSAIVASFSGVIGGWPGIVQLLVYLVAGIVWILPLKPLLAWMEGGGGRVP